MRDIENNTDIEFIVQGFYERALKDPIIGHIFKEADFSLAEHIPVMVSFWETILLDVHTYSGNPMIKHLGLHQVAPLTPAHFERWLLLWEEVLRKHFNGTKTDEAVSRAGSIAKMMQIKIAGKV